MQYLLFEVHAHFIKPGIRLLRRGLLLFLVPFLFASLPAEYLSAGVMMQGFYWEVPSGGRWYDLLGRRAEELANMQGGYGIDRIWFPPPAKGINGLLSMGYEPYDYYDLGEYMQKGSRETRYGSRKELQAAIRKFSSQGIDCIADIVVNHRAGGQREENPVAGRATWTDFSGVESGKCRWNWQFFHPNRKHERDPESLGGFPDICYRGTGALADMKSWLAWLQKKSIAGFRGWRFDFAKGVETPVIRELAAATPDAFAVADYWEADVGKLSRWGREAGVAVFDYPLYKQLESVCNKGGDMRRLVNRKHSVSARSPELAVSYVANHDTDTIRRHKMLAYAFILTWQGYPSIFWKDYYNRGFSAPRGVPENGIRALVWAREKLAGGSPKPELLVNRPDILVYQNKARTKAAPGYVFVLAGPGYTGGKRWIKGLDRSFRNRSLNAYAWEPGGGTPKKLWVNTKGEAEIAPQAASYRVYAPDGLMP